MDIQETFRCLTTNTFIPKLEYTKYELRFQTVFKVSEFSYQCCPCALEHEFVTYISNDGTINKEVYDRILQCITEGKCPHVEYTMKDATAETKVYAYHIAAAVNTSQVPWANLNLLQSSLFLLTPYSIALLKQNVSFINLTPKDRRDGYPTLNELMLCYTESRKKPSIITFKPMMFSEMCVLTRNLHTLKTFDKLSPRPPWPSTELVALVLQHSFTDMRTAVLGEKWRHSLIFTGVDTAIRWCEVAFLYDDNLILAGILNNYDLHKENPRIQFTQNKHQVTRTLHELSSLLKRTSCESVVSKHCSDTCSKTSSLSIVLTALSAIMRSRDPKIHAEIAMALKRTQNIGEMLNTNGVHDIVLTDIKNGKIDVLRTMLDLGVDINGTVNGKTLLNKILEVCRGGAELPQRMAVEMILYENPDVRMHSKAAVIAAESYIKLTPQRRGRISYHIEYCITKTCPCNIQ